MTTISVPKNMLHQFISSWVMLSSHKFCACIQLRMHCKRNKICHWIKKYIATLQCSLQLSHIHVALGKCFVSHFHPLVVMVVLQLKWFRDSSCELPVVIACNNYTHLTVVWSEHLKGTVLTATAPIWHHYNDFMTCLYYSKKPD